jgi:hypothetical protein
MIYIYIYIYKNTTNEDKTLYEIQEHK